VLLTGFPGKPGMTAAVGYLSGRVRDDKCEAVGRGNELLQKMF
jgi:hypothetical protein